MSLPSVAVVIPVHNRTEFLGEAIVSVLAQDYPGRVEIVVVDDGSSLPIPPCFTERFPRVTFLRQEHRGVAAARQAGSDATATELIAYLDDDDLWTTQALKYQVEFLMAHPWVGMVWADVSYFRPGRLPGSIGWYGRFEMLSKAARVPAAGESRGWVYRREALIHQALLHEPAYPSALVIRREFLTVVGGWNDAAEPHLDCFDIFWRATLSGAIGFNDRVLVHIRRGHPQTTSDLARSRLVQTRSLYRWAREAGSGRTEVAPLLARRFLGLAWRFVRQGSLKLALEHGLRGVVLIAAAPLAFTRRPWVLVY